MSNNDNLKLTAIQDLFSMNFFIPNYQRGYRWTEQQVKDLLDDIYEFQNKTKSPDEIYCIQPLVVKTRKEDTFRKIKEEAQNIDEIKAMLKGSWDVIDGQQRLTTIHILLSYLEPNLKYKYSIEYETRKADRYSSIEFKKTIGSKEFLENIKEGSFRNQEDFQKITNSNIDFFHIHQTYKTIERWFESHAEERIELLGILKNKVQFIWYETDETDPIRVFTRLNIGKIALTDAELIKALFLNRTNFGIKDSEQIRLQQVEIASEWDRIEYTLQNDEFWLFIHNLGWTNPTRIDFIFDMMREQNVFGLPGDWGNDEHKTFRYFYEYFNISKSNINAEWIRKTWHTVKTYFQIFEEWYNDLEFYHYIGFLVNQGCKIKELIELYKGDKEIFKVKIKTEIKGKIQKCSDLDRVYGENGEKKTECRPLLILYNIQTVINQNRELIKDKKYGFGAFYKFPFHLFKKEGKKKNGKGWEVEHIASNSGDNLESLKNQKIWLASVVYCLPAGELKTDIEYFIGDKEGRKSFDEIRSEIKKLDINPLDDIDKQRIWNYALLDSTTNEEYQNDPFPIKRICVLAKEQGHKANVIYDEREKHIEIDKSTSAIAFVPPCTKNVFIKAYTAMPKSLSVWSKDDAEAYQQNIKQVLIEFLS